MMPIFGQPDLSARVAVRVRVHDDIGSATPSEATRRVMPSCRPGLTVASSDLEV